MKISVHPSGIEGSVEAPPSKSYSHRGILAGAYSSELVVENTLLSADTRASVRCAELLGSEVTRTDDELEIRGVSGRPHVPPDVLNCGNSGTTLRLFSGLSALVDGEVVLTGDSSLRERPNAPLIESLNELGADARSTRGEGYAPVIVEGRMEGGKTSIDGSVSSQFISSLLFAAPVTDEGAMIRIEGELKSKPYVDITLEVLDELGVEYRETSDGYDVDGNQSYDSGSFRVPGDFSSASYPLAAAAVAGEAEVTNLHPGPQGDSFIVDVIDEMGADVEWNRDKGTVSVGSRDLEGIEFDAGDNPDLVPTVAVLGAVANGETHVYNAGHLRLKETDRLDATATELEKMGAEVDERETELTVYGEETELEGAVIDGRHDHRIVMAFAVAGLAAKGKTVIETAESIDVSYPGFVEDFSDLGADIEYVG
ncbi:MAG: 3-phosphoshikimate 1-carboxyvinyltransferase [Halobacteria archaeon]